MTRLFACLFPLIAVVLLAVSGVPSLDAVDDAVAVNSREVAKLGLPDGVRNSQKPTENPLTPRESLQKMTVPEGFRVTLFAGEPNVAQPIAMTFDPRGRLWVAECYSYKNWKSQPRDRIVIFEDTDHDGEFDRHRIFAENIRNLTGIAVGFGGVWVCSAPELLFIPDRDGDDVPDGPAEVILDGWTLKAGHNIYNGLTWAPDGWLWGRHGITAESHIGPPGAADGERVKMRCGIWRYHPVQKRFEVVCHGTTNPWGLDFNDYGAAFFTNCVIGHLWHVIPGARYKRMHGQHYNRYLYELIQATSDHLHWGGGKWTSSRGGKGKHDEAGGGHAHCGGMIYLGDNWPAEYRGDIFMCNIHGNRVNRDKLIRRGSGYVGKHAPDFLMANDPWFRGTTLKYGPDGGVYVADWTDFGECHDNDGVHRSSGRVYKITYGTPKEPPHKDVADLSDAELVALQLHRNDWYVRQARRILQERAVDGRVSTDATAALRKMLHGHGDVTRRLRALWCLNAIGAADTKLLLKLLEDKEETVRSWAVRLLVDEQKVPPAAVERFVAMAGEDDSQLVRLYLASALQRLPLSERLPIAEGLISHEEDEKDPNLPLMIWYGIEPALAADKVRALSLVPKCKLTKVRRFIARRVTEKSQK